MPLSKPARRTQHHRREIVCEGYLRDDGLWDIEARMTDKKSHAIDNPERGGYVAAGEHFHDISMRLTMDKRLLIHHVEACMDATPFKMCPGIAQVYKQLEGTQIGPGWHRKVLDMTSGVAGCTHLNELLKPLTTTAIQAIWPSGDAEMVKLGAKGLLNTCHTWAQNSPVVQNYVPHLFISEPPNA